MISSRSASATGASPRTRSPPEHGDVLADPAPVVEHPAVERGCAPFEVA